MRAIAIKAGDIALRGVLNESATATAIWTTLPIKAEANTWGDEIYFAIPVTADREDAVSTVALGTIAYWPPGKALCLFFGPTPASDGDEIRPASPVNVVGTIEGDIAMLRRVRSGAVVEIARA